MRYTEASSLGITGNQGIKYKCSMNVNKSRRTRRSGLVFHSQSVQWPESMQIIGKNCRMKPLNLYAR